jgi:hypothetical protein
LPDLLGIRYDIYPTLSDIARKVVKELLFFQRVADNAVIRVYDDAGNVVETHNHAGDFKEP